MDDNRVDLLEKWYKAIGGYEILKYADYRREAFKTLLAWLDSPTGKCEECTHHYTNKDYPLGVCKLFNSTHWPCEHYSIKRGEKK